MSGIAIFGGTFDPPTLAHERIIESCLSREDLDEVWVMPSGTRVDKPGMSDDEVRVGMLRQVHADTFYNDERLVVSDFEINLPRPNKTIDTVSALEATYPKINFWFVFGADSYRTMHTWESGEELKSRLGMLIVGRCGEVLPEETDNIKHLKVPELEEIEVSSTKIRESVSCGLAFDNYASPAVVKYILNNSLYIS